jgi:Kef-type K+ transport system membrane component KefB
MIEVFTADLALIIVTATLLAFLARKTGQPTIIAYIATGLVLGPVMFDLVVESEMTHLMSELGLGFLLFLLGIEMNLKELEDLLKPIANIAIWQTVLQTGFAFLIPLLLGFSFLETLVIALCTVFGATPVIVKLLTDKDEISSLPGRIDVGVLILQDIYLIIILALFSADSLTSASQIGFQLVKIFSLIGLIGGFSYLSAQYFLPKLFKRIADNKHAFFVHGIAWAFLFISLALALDLSIEVGAFLAGLGLGQMPYRNELKERVRPLTDFFIVIFFSSIALTLETSNLYAYWLEAVVASVLLMIGNFMIMFYLINRLGFDAETSFLGSINMTQVSEFSLVVGGLAVTQGYIGNDILGYLSLMALMTMTASTYLINYNREIFEKVEHLLERFDSESNYEASKLENHAVVVGYDNLAMNAVSELEKFYEDVVVVDRNPENVEELEISEHEYIYGDITHGEVRKNSGLKRADFVISFVPDMNINKQVLRSSKEDATRILKARNFEEASELYELGAHYVIIKNTLSGDKLGEQLKLYFEDRDLFLEEVKEEHKKIQWRNDRWK